MIRKRLEELQHILKSTIFKRNRNAASLLEIIEEDLNKLDKKIIFDNKSGSINYYAPNAAQQFEETRKILEKYKDKVTTLQHDLQNNPGNELLLLNLSKLNLSKKLNDLGDKLDRDLAHHHTLSADLSRGLLDVKRALTILLERNSRESSRIARTELDVKTKMLIETENEILSELTTVDKELNALNSQPQNFILKNQIYRTKIELKRKLATSRMAQETNEANKKALDEAIAIIDKKPSLEFSEHKETDEKIVEMLNSLQVIMKRSISDFQQIVIKGGNFKSLLHQATAFYWENLYLYRQILFEISNTLKKLNTKHQLTEQGRFIAECIEKAFNKVPPIDEIEKARGYVQENDQKLFKNTQDLSTDSTTLPNETPEAHLKKLSSMIFYSPQLGADGQNGKLEFLGDFFYVPYNAANYVLDHPAKTDYMNALGNCHGESMMFLQRLNSRKPNFNNICPERDLLSFQLDQSKKISGLPKKTQLVKKKISAEEKRVQWEHLKESLLAPVGADVKNGELCLLKLRGGNIDTRKAPVGHDIAFVKLKKPSPYKYIVNNYSVGIVGLTSDEQLEKYMTYLTNYYIPFNSFVLEKHGEVSDDSYQFINSIKPINKQSQLQNDYVQGEYKRNYWNKDRLTLLATYQKSKETFDLLIEQITDPSSSLNADDKHQLYELLSKMPYKKVVNSNPDLAIKYNNFQIMKDCLESFPVTDLTKLNDTDVRRKVLLVNTTKLLKAIMKLSPEHNDGKLDTLRALDKKGVLYFIIRERWKETKNRDKTGLFFSCTSSEAESIYRKLQAIFKQPLTEDRVLNVLQVIHNYIQQNPKDFFSQQLNDTFDSLGSIVKSSDDLMNLTEMGGQPSRDHSDTTSQPNIMKI